jgi:hypothetical protein
MRFLEKKRSGILAGTAGMRDDGCSRHDYIAAKCKTDPGSHARRLIPLRWGRVKRANDWLDAEHQIEATCHPILLLDYTIDADVTSLSALVCAHRQEKEANRKSPSQVLLLFRWKR